MPDTYWHLILFDGEKVPVKPDNVAYVQKKLASKEPITTPTRTIMASNVRDFLPTDIPVQKRLAIEGAAHAFNEPEYNPDGSVVSKAVKKAVPRRKYETYYAHNPAYKMLAENETGVVIGFMLPVHLVDYEVVSDCFPDEADKVERRDR